jgi:hypothetical protein
LRRDCGDKVGSSFLRRKSHLGRINQMPAAKASRIEGLQSGA